MPICTRSMAKTAPGGEEKDKEKGKAETARRPPPQGPKVILKATSSVASKTKTAPPQVTTKAASVVSSTKSTTTRRVPVPAQAPIPEVEVPATSSQRTKAKPKTRQRKKFAGKQPTLFDDSTSTDDEVQVVESRPRRDKKAMPPPPAPAPPAKSVQEIREADEDRKSKEETASASSTTGRSLRPRGTDKKAVVATATTTSSGANKLPPEFNNIVPYAFASQCRMVSEKIAKAMAYSKEVGENFDEMAASLLNDMKKEAGDIKRKRAEEETTSVKKRNKTVERKISEVKENTIKTKVSVLNKKSEDEEDQQQGTSSGVLELVAPKEMATKGDRTKTLDALEMKRSIQRGLVEEQTESRRTKPNTTNDLQRNLVEPAPAKNLRSSSKETTHPSRERTNNEQEETSQMARKRSTAKTEDVQHLRQMKSGAKTMPVETLTKPSHPKVALKRRMDEDEDLNGSVDMFEEVESSNATPVSGLNFNFLSVAEAKLSKPTKKFLLSPDTPTGGPMKELQIPEENSVENDCDVFDSSVVIVEAEEHGFGSFVVEQPAATNCTFVVPKEPVMSNATFVVPSCKGPPGSNEESPQQPHRLVPLDTTVVISKPKCPQMPPPPGFLPDFNSSRHQKSVILDTLDEEGDSDEASPVNKGQSVPVVPEKVETLDTSTSSSSSACSYKSALSHSSQASSKAPAYVPGPKTHEHFSKRAEEAQRIKDETLKKKQELQKKKNEEWKQRADKIKKAQEDEVLMKAQKMNAAGPSYPIHKTFLPGKPPKPVPPLQHAGLKPSGPMKGFTNKPIVGKMSAQTVRTPQAKTPVQQLRHSADQVFKTPTSPSFPNFSFLDATVDSGVFSSYDITRYEDLDEDMKHRENKHVPDWARNKQDVAIGLFKQIRSREIQGVGFPFPMVERGSKLYPDKR